MAALTEGFLSLANVVTSSVKSLIEVCRGAQGQSGELVTKQISCAHASRHGIERCSERVLDVLLLLLGLAQDRRRHGAFVPRKLAPQPTREFLDALRR